MRQIEREKAAKAKAEKFARLKALKAKKEEAEMPDTTGAASSSTPTPSLAVDDLKQPKAEIVIPITSNDLSDPLLDPKPEIEVTVTSSDPKPVPDLLIECIDCKTGLPVTDADIELFNQANS